MKLNKEKINGKEKKQSKKIKQSNFPMNSALQGGI
jgi:hypothetical protein